MAALGWLLNLGFGGGEVAAVVATVSSRYSLEGTDNTSKSLVGVDNTSKELEGTDTSSFSLTGI